MGRDNTSCGTRQYRDDVHEVGGTRERGIMGKASKAMAGTCMLSETVHCSECSEIGERCRGAEHDCKL